MENMDLILKGAIDAAERGASVLVACAAAGVRAGYLSRIPEHLDVSVETIEEAFRIPQASDEQYTPPDYLKGFDLIVIDGLPEINSHMWNCIRQAMVFVETGPLFACSPDCHRYCYTLGGAPAEGMVPTTEEEESPSAITLGSSDTPQSEDEAPDVAQE